LLLPPTRSVIRRIVVRRLGQRVTVAAPMRTGGYDVEGTAREYDDSPQHRLER
jgi:hypothetical protein